MFNQAVIQGEEARALHMCDLYMSTLLDSSNDVVPIILGKLEKDT